MAKTYDQIYTALNVSLRDTDDRTFTQDEKYSVLTRVITTDPWVRGAVRDDTTIVVANQPTYPLPIGMVSVATVLYDYYDDGYGTPLSSQNFEVIDGDLVLSRAVKNLVAGKKLILRGMKRYTTADSIPDLQSEYVVHVATAKLFEILLSDKTNFFLINELSMGEVISAIRYHTTEAERIKSQISDQLTTEF